jgi:hypothetical protein
MLAGRAAAKVAPMLPVPRPLPAALLALGAVLAAAPGASGAAAAARRQAAPRAELRAVAGKPSSATAKPGDTVTVKVTLRNTGRGRAAATKTRISLGAGRGFAGGDLVLATLRQGPLARGRRAKPVTARLRIPLDARAGGRRTLLVCADAEGKIREHDEKDNCAAAGIIAFPVVDAESLIGADLAAKRIDEEQAWALRVMALAAAPEALPERYRGATTAGTDATSAVTEAAARFPALSPKTQKLLAPLFAPPGHVAAPAKGKGKTPKTPHTPKAPKRPSAHAAAQPPPRPNHCLAQSSNQVPDTNAWGSVTAPSSKVTFWWPKSKKGGAAIARTFATAMDSTIWPKLTGLMERTPKSDGELDCGHGDSGGVDVYIVDTLGGRPANGLVDLGVTTPYTCLTEPNAGFVKIADGRVTTLAHEFMHVLQLAYADQGGCDRPAWLDEGIADFASEYAYSGSLQNTSASWLEQFGTDLESRSYDAWPFWYSVALEAGPEAFAATYGGLAGKSRIAAVDAGIGTFRKRWPEFARSGYNQEPVHSFATWAPKTTLKPNLVGSLVSLDGQTTKTVPYLGSARLDALTRDYTSFAFDAQVRKITLAGLPVSDDYHLHALMRMRDGTWREQDVTKGLTLCRDRPAEDVQELVLVASNASVATRLTADPKLTVEDTCGLPRFRVLAAKFSLHTTGETQDDEAQECDALGVSGTEDYGGQLTAAVDDPEFKLTKKLDGRLAGDVFFDVPADGTTQLQGCTKPPPTHAEQACSATKSIRKAQGKELIGFEIEVEPHRADEARLRWSISEASIGYFDADDTVCNVYEFYNTVGPDQQVKTVPLEELQHGTHTFSNTGTFAWHVDEKTSTPAEITLGWSYDVTLQVIDKDGNPVP